MSYVISVANEKGGVANTTSAVSLAGALAEMQKRTLLVDMDTQGNLTLALGKDPRQINFSISNVLLNSEPISKAIQVSPIENLELVPANKDVALAERFLPVRQNHETILRNAISNNLAYDYIILDCPPSLGSITINALVASNLLLIPTQAEYFSVYALKSMMALIREVREKYNPNLIYRVLITMFEPRNRTHRKLRQQLNETFGSFGLLDTIIEADTKLRESPIVGIPITHFTSKSRSAQQYRALAQELTADHGNPRPKEQLK
jgi:chromosome partitioning protein